MLFYKHRKLPFKPDLKQERQEMTSKRVGLQLQLLAYSLDTLQKKEGILRMYPSNWVSLPPSVPMVSFTSFVTQRSSLVFHK